MLETNISKLEKYKRIATLFCSQMLETNISKLKNQQDDNYIFQPNVGNKHFQIEKQQDDNYIFTATCWKQTFPNWKNTRW